MTTIANMTLEELQKLIDERVDQRLRLIMPEIDTDEDNPFWEDEPDEEDTRTWEEVKADIKRKRWTPPPGTPSLVELIREDKDR